MGSTETDIIWENYMKPRHAVTVEDDNACDDDHSEENAFYCEIPNHYSDVEYQQMFYSEGESQFWILGKKLPIFIEFQPIITYCLTFQIFRCILLYRIQTKLIILIMNKKMSGREINHSALSGVAIMGLILSWNFWQKYTVQSIFFGNLVQTVKWLIYGYVRQG